MRRGLADVDGVLGPGDVWWVPWGVLAVLLASTAIWWGRSGLPLGLHNVHEQLHLLGDILVDWERGALEAMWTHRNGDHHTPPLLHFGMALARDRVGPTLWLVPLLGSLALAVLAWGTHRCGLALFDRECGRLAASTVVTFPVFLGLSRLYEPTLASAALGTVALSFLISSEGLTRRGHSLAAGLVLALALLTERVLALLYFAPPLIFVWLQARKTGRSASRGILLVALPVALLAGPFLFVWFSTNVADPHQLEGMLAPGEQSGFFESHAPRLAYYPVMLFTNLLEPVWGTALLLSLIGWAWLPREGRAFLAAWTVPPLLLFTIMGKKDTTYLLPLLPACALIVAAALRHALPARGRGPLQWALLAAGLGLCLGSSFGFHPLEEQAALISDHLGQAPEREWLGSPLRAENEVRWTRKACADLSHLVDQGASIRIRVENRVDLHSLPPRGRDIALGLMAAMRFIEPRLRFTEGPPAEALLTLEDVRAAPARRDPPPAAAPLATLHSDSGFRASIRVHPNIGEAGRREGSAEPRQSPP